MEGTVDASASAGKDLVLTLDKYLTYLTEQALAAAVTKHGAKAATSVMIDPRTGEILAMASVPGYNPTVPLTQLSGARATGPSPTLTSPDPS